jgi:hypothetical protein
LKDGGTRHCANSRLTLRITRKAPEYFAYFQGIEPHFRKSMPRSCCFEMRDVAFRETSHRQSGQKSAGSRSNEGKAKSAQNSVKQSFRASSFAVVRIAISQQQMLRGARLEAACSPRRPSARPHDAR